jgi:hypothetical protein
MSQQINTYRNDTLNFNEADQYTLLLLVEALSFTYAVVLNQQLLAYDAHCALAELSHPQQLQQILSASYKKVVIGLTGDGFTLVPTHLFKTNRVVDIARLLDVKEKERVLAQPLDENNQVVYKVGEQRLEAVAKFDLKNIVFAANGLAKAITHDNPSNNNLYLHIATGKVEFLYFKHNKLRFYNSFEFKSADDVVYFSALVTRELDLSPQHITLVISGNINSGDGTYIRLAEFFPEVAINKIKLLELPAQIAHHQIISLAALTLCGSSEVL